MSVHNRLPQITDAELPNVPSSIDATRAPDDNNKTLIYDKSDDDENAWIQGHTVNPENIKTGR